MNSEVYTAVLIGVMSIVTILLRGLPFIIFRGRRRLPPSVSYLGRVLPAATMGMLVIYCLRDISLIDPPFGLPELTACAVTAAAQIISKNVIVSIIGGTAAFLIIIHMI